MKIKSQKMNYEDVLALPRRPRFKPKRTSIFFRLLMRFVAAGELKKARFSCKEIGMGKLSKKEPCLILMNHSSFIDLKIAVKAFFSRSFNIVCTADGLVGKEWLMRQMGCIPTQKFVKDMALVYDMRYALKTLKNSVLLYPEASYSFDGTATPLPDNLAKLIKTFQVPVVMIRTFGAFSRDPLYNNLQLRDVDVSAEVEYLLSPEDIRAKTTQEIDALMRKHFTFDNFRWQQEQQVRIEEEFRADYLNRVLYKCPCCKTEGKMQGRGVTLTCTNCNKSYELTEYGFLKANAGEAEFSHIPDWFAWQRRCVREELEADSYRLDIPVNISMMVDTSCIYDVGKGRLVHHKGGFELTGCDGKLHYTQKPGSSYSLYSDYYWYEIGDVICIGDSETSYYCFPEEAGDVVAKTRLAVEELYKLVRTKKETIGQ